MMNNTQKEKRLIEENDNKEIRYKLKKYEGGKETYINGLDRFKLIADVCIDNDCICYLVIQYRRVVGLACEEEGVIYHLAGRTPLIYPRMETKKDSESK